VGRASRLSPRPLGCAEGVHEEAERLRAAMVALSSSLDVQQVLVLILSELQRVVPHDSASVQELRGERLQIVAGHGFPNLPEILGLSFDTASTGFPNREVIERKASEISLPVSA
jgi:hypothetical protein